ncbi:MAG: hypothetical protein QM758_13825 [Armatimonas sp.]
MAILQALFVTLSWRTGQIINTLAIQFLFSKVTKDRQMLVSGTTLCFVLWLISMIGTTMPFVDTILLALVALAHWIERAWVSMVIAILSVLIPPIIG